MSELTHYISKYFGVTAEDVTIISQLFKQTSLNKGAFFLKKEQFCNRLSFVKSGYLRIYAPHQDKEITQWISSPGYFVTELASFLFQQRSRFNIQAISDCELYSISSDDYQKLPDYIENWTKIEKQFMASCFIILEDRVFQHLSLSAEQRYQKLFEQDKTLFQQIPLQYLASMLGMSAETFSRIRAKQTS